jgi:transposase
MQRKKQHFDKKNSPASSVNCQPSLFENSGACDRDEISNQDSLCHNPPQTSRKSTMNTTHELTQKPTYSQNWKSYNQAQKSEKGMLLSLLHELCSGISEPEQTMGRPRASLKDAIFAITLKNYTTLSGRRNNSDITDAHDKGFLSQPISYNTIFKYMQDERVTELLREMILTSAQALQEIETDFAFDSTGFGTTITNTWYNVKYGNSEDWRDWFKLHACIGVKTGIVASFEISERYSHDSKYFKPMFDSTKERGFQVEKVFADKAYGSRANLRLVVENDAKVYIPFKSNAKFSKRDTVWNSLLHYFCAYKSDFYSFYHQRSNVEAVFSSMKRKFNARLTSKTKPAQINEILARVLAYNLTVVIKVLFELDINPSFTK